MSEVRDQIRNAPETITNNEADHLQSVESRAQGGGRPPKGGIAAQAQSIAAANENGAKSRYINNNNGAGGVNAAEQSQSNREANWADAAQKISDKMANDPSSITKKDAGEIHKREQRAFGTTEKGGLASEAHKLADQNK